MTHYLRIFCFLCRGSGLAGLLLLASCAEVQQLARAYRPTVPPLEYYGWLESADQQTLAMEHERLAANIDSPAPDINLIQRAMLYSVPATADDGDNATAIDLLSVVLQESPDATSTSQEETSTVQNEPSAAQKKPSAAQEQYIAFARIWLDLLENRRASRLARENQDSDRDRIQDLSIRIAELEKQIEALTTIEQRLIEREKTQAQPL